MMSNASNFIYTVTPQFWFGCLLRDFSENNYKTQTISLVRKRLKLIWNITTRVQRGRFPGFFILLLREIELKELDF